MKKSKIVAIIMMAFAKTSVKTEGVFQIKEGIMDLPESWIEKGVSFFSSELSKGYEVEDIETNVRGTYAGTIYVNFLNRISGANCSTGTEYKISETHLTKNQLLKQRQFLA